MKKRFIIAYDTDDLFLAETALLYIINNIKKMIGVTVIESSIKEKKQ